MRFSAKITAFLAAIRVTPSVTRAALAVGMNKSLHYAKLKSCPAYALAFDEALRIGFDAVSDVAVARATEGWEEPVVYQGSIAQQDVPGTDRKVPVTIRKFDNQLLKFILERRHPDYRELAESSDAVDIHVLMENLHAGRQRVAEERAEREAKQKTDPVLEEPSE